MLDLVDLEAQQLTAAQATTNQHPSNRLGREAKDGAVALFSDQGIDIAVLDTEIHDRTAFAEAPATWRDANSKATEEIVSLTKEVIAKCLAAQPVEVPLAFGNLKPSIVREPSSQTIPREAESRLLDLPAEEPASTPIALAPAPHAAAVVKRANAAYEEPPSAAPQLIAEPAARPALDSVSPFSSRGLLVKKKREALVPVTFRMKQSLRELLQRVADERELSQTDLINEGIELNLKRYL